MLPDNSTIIALSSPYGRGAISIIRISGGNTKYILENLIKKENHPFQKNPRKVYKSSFYINSQVIDEGMFVFFKGPYSYTGEDLAEIYIHGNPIIVKKIINFVAQTGWARPSKPGEFTRRAFINGKMDLTKAESIHRIITARSEYELNAIKNIYFGDLYKLVHKIRSEIINIKAFIEAEIDFSDEDIDLVGREKIKENIKNIIKNIHQLLEKSSVVSKVSQGFSIAIVGKPNTGKSSLLNKILGWDRSIVSEVEGTTRDYISEEIEYMGMPVRITDTAGLRKTDDFIEKEGIRRSRQIVEKSEIILHLIDASLEKYDFLQDYEDSLKQIILSNEKKVIHILNKIDKKHHQSWNEESLKNYITQPIDIVKISCKTGEGISELKLKLEKMISVFYEIKDPFLLEERHHYHFQAIIQSLNKVIDLWKYNAPDEIISLEFDNVLQNISQLTGEVTTEEVLGRIFSMFCIGK